jgi:hypothetical protein
MIGFYGTFSLKRVWKREDIAPEYNRLVRQAHAAGKKVFLPTHPGHDNSGFRPNDHFVMPRDEGATLRGYLRASAGAGADVILLTSFNEWPETTIVEPSSSWADPYLHLKILAEWQGKHFVAPPVLVANLGKIQRFEFGSGLPKVGQHQGAHRRRFAEGLHGLGQGLAGARVLGQLAPGQFQV